MPASTFYSSYVLPSRPARPTLSGSKVPPPNPTASTQSSRAVSPPPDPAEDSTPPADAPRPLDPQTFLAHLDIKHTPQKKLAPFLKLIEKDGMIKLKEVRGELMLFSVDAKHPALTQAQSWGWTTIGAEEKRQRDLEAESSSTNGLGSGREILVEEVWFPEGGVDAFFESCGVRLAPHSHIFFFNKCD
jgi:hypothetical protein